jgi:hypothetical protein
MNVRLCAPINRTWTLALWLGLVPCIATASTIFASAPLGPTGQTSGTDVSALQQLGVRFYISSATQITAVGGHLLAWFPSPDNPPDISLLYAAIYPLADASAFPNGTPDAAVPVAKTTFTLEFPSTDYRVALSVELQPGWYGLVFGAGEFGSPSTAVGMMADYGYYTEGSFFQWGEILVPQPGGGLLSTGEYTWMDAPSSSPLRFVVEGDAVTPEPGSFAAVAAGITLILVVFGKRLRSAL